MSFIPLPEGNNTPETVRRLRALDAEFFGSISAARGTLGSLDVTGNITVDTGSITAGDTTSSFYVQMDELGLSFPYGGTLISAPDLWPYIRTGIASINPGEMSVQLLIQGAFWSGFDRPWITMSSDDYTVGSNPYIQMGIGSMASDVFTIQSGKAVVSDDAVLLIANGTAGAPSLGFDTDTNTGIYRHAADQLGFSTAGARRLLIDTSGVTVTGRMDITGYIFGPTWLGSADGTAGAPSITWNADQNTGIYRHAADMVGITTGGGVRGIFRNPTVNGVIGTREEGSLIVLGSDLGTSAGNLSRAASFRMNNGNSGTLEILSIRTSAGSNWTTASMGIQRITDATAQSSVWFDGAGVGVNTSEPDAYSAALAVNGMIATVPGTASGSNAHLVAISGGFYALRIQSSSRRFKENIRDLEPSKARLRPTRFWSKADERDLLGLIAEEVVEALGPEAAVYDENGEVRDYFDRAVIAHLVAKVNELEQEITKLKGKK